MGIRIEKVTVKNLGPIQDFSENLGLFNLIFSNNECGKTFLTEFMIRSLFRNTRRWKFRESGNGKVTVSGLDGNSFIEFSPASARKLEDWWQQDGMGLPPSMVKLLVSKGGEASIEETDEGIGKSLIKEIFSGISLLDRIDSEKNISTTVQKAQLEGNNIIIANTGEGKTFRQLKSEMDHIDSLFSEIESKYSKGVLEAYKTEERQLARHIENLYRAKCHQAFLISEEIKNLNQKLAYCDDEALAGLGSDISNNENLKAEYSGKTKQSEELAGKSGQFEWLQKALLLYEKLSTASVKRPKIIIVILSAVFAAAAIVFSIFNISIGTILSLAAASGLIVFYITRLVAGIKNAASFEEMTKLENEFKKRTGSDLAGIASLNLEIDRQREAYDNSKLLSRQLEDLKAKIQASESAIQKKFNNLTGKQITEQQWQSALSDKKAQNRELKERIERLRAGLTDLAVRELEYLPDDPGIKFSYDEWEKTAARAGELQVKIDEIERDIGNLKYSICNITGDDQTIDWEHLLENLDRKRSETQNEYDICQSQIIAGILVHSEIEKLRQEEDIKISEGLKSDTVLKPLMEVTKNYKRLFLDGDSLMISDDYKDYCIRDLSTGAREQIMLALRIGFASKILKQDCLFLILDDAFQHSDWKRREVLVKKLADIAQKGWQIIYLSMDDHIKELFEKAGSGFKKDQYRYIELKG